MNKPVSQLELIRSEPEKIKSASRVETKAYVEQPQCNDGVEPFSWTEHVDDIVLEEQPRTAVYENGSGAVVILQQAGTAYDDDQIVRFRPENLLALIAALQRFVP